MKRVLIGFACIFLFCSLGCSQNSSNFQRTSTNGEIFTPKGDLRALIIYAGFKGHDKKQDLKRWKHDAEFPDYVKDEAFLEGFFKDTSQFENYPSPDNKSISRLFYEMSGKKFRFMADVYPHRININPKINQGWSLMNHAVIKQMQKEDPDFDWSPYDNRKNRPNYLFDNSLTGPDGKPDYVIIVYRYDKNWAHQPAHRMNLWSGSGGGISILQGVRNFKYSDQYTITTDGFHMNTVGVRDPSDFIRLFQHELGHELISCPHHFGTGGTIGQYFRSSNFGWGTAVSSITSTLLINSWERWMLGWIDIKHDLKNFNDNGTYTLGDYATTGDVIRIKIPHTESQYLWIENHQKESVFDYNTWRGKLEGQPNGSSGIADLDKGLYFYVEDLMDEREKIRTYLVSNMKKVNGTKFLNAGGNWDYDVPVKKTKSWAEYWNNDLYHFNRAEQNPFSGINPFQRYRFDADGNGVIHNRHNFNGSRDVESFPIIKEVVGDTALLFYANHGGLNENAKPYRRSQAFQLGDTLSMSHNPPIINNPRYIPREGKERPVFINGLKVIIHELDNGTYTISVEFDNNKMNHDTRVAGNVVLKKIPNVDIDVDVYENVKLTVNKSGTINCLEKLDGSFTHETNFVIDSASIRLQENSSFSVFDASIVLFKTGSQLILSSKAKVTVTNEAQLLLASGSQITLDNKTEVVCSKKGTIKLQKGAIVNGVILKEDFTLPLEDKCSGKQLLKALEKLSR